MRIDRSFYSRLTYPGLALIAVCYGLARFAYGLFVPAFRTEFSLSDTLLGVIGAGSYVGYCLAILVAAAAVPRLGARAVAGIAGGVATAGMALIAAAPNALVLSAAVLLAGSSTGLASPPIAAALARSLPDTVQDRAQAVANSGSGAGIALSGSAALLAVNGWRWAWLGFAVVAGLVSIWAVLAIPPASADVAHGGEVPDPEQVRGGGDVLAFATEPASLRMVVGATLLGVGTACMWTFGRDHTTGAGGLSESTSTVLWIILGVAGLIGAAGGELVTRQGLSTAWRTCLLAVAVSMFAVGTLPSSTPAMAGAMAAFGAAYITLTLVVLLWAVRLHPERVSASVGLGFLMLAFGQALGAPLAGLLTDHAGATATFGASALLAALTGLLVNPGAVRHGSSNANDQKAAAVATH